MSSDSSLASLDKFLFKMNESGVDSTPIASDEQADVNCELVLKRCSVCQEGCPVIEFYKCPTTKDGYHSYCKSCFKIQTTKTKKRQRDNEFDEEDVLCDTADSLYIMENPRIPGEIKIGRSYSPEERAKQLASGHNFRLIVKYSYGGKGFLEKTLHHKLKHLRVEEVAGIEWFKLTPDQADLLIRASILEHDLQT